MFGARVIGVQISRYGDGMNFERLSVNHRAIWIYTIGRTHLIELLHTEMQNDQVRIVDGSMSRRAYEQLMGLETEMREAAKRFEFERAAELRDKARELRAKVLG